MDREPSPCFLSSAGYDHTFIPNVPVRRCSVTDSLEPNIHISPRAQRFPGHVQALFCFLTPWGPEHLSCLVAVLFWFNHHWVWNVLFNWLATCIFQCDTHPVLINDDSKSLCAQPNESQGATSFSVLENSYFPLLGDWPSHWTGNGIGNRISQLKAFFKSGPCLEEEWMNL